jgi:hypothetical protein
LAVRLERAVANNSSAVPMLMIRFMMVSIPPRLASVLSRH